MIDIRGAIFPNRVIAEDEKINSIVTTFQHAKEITVKDTHLLFRKTGIGYDLGIPLGEDGTVWVDHIYLEPVFDNLDHKLFYNNKSRQLYLTLSTDNPTADDIVYMFMTLTK